MGSPVARQYTTIGIEGGMRMPSEPAAVTIPTENFSSYFAFIRAGIMIEPIAATVAGDDPEIAAKNAHAAVAAIARPPGSRPKKSVATRISFFERPPAVMMLPERTKSGIAISANESAELNICWTTTSSGPS